jgi:hypothetical protein
MGREVVDNLPGNSAPRKVRGKGREQVRTFVNVIDEEVDQTVRLITGNDAHNKAKRFLLQFLPKVRIP